MFHSVITNRMSEIKQYLPVAIALFTVLGAISTYWFYTSSVMKVVNNPESFPEVAEDIIEKEIVKPLERKANLIVIIANIITSLPPIIIVLIIFAYAYISKKYN